MGKRDYSVQADWQRKKTKLYSTRISRVQESDMIDWLDNLGVPFGQYIRTLIRADMEAHSIKKADE